MATIYDKDNNEFLHIGVPFNYTRGNPMPLDNSTVWNSYNAAHQYAINSPVAYVGQILTVKETDAKNDVSYTAYLINNEAGDLKKIGEGGSSEELAAKLSAEIARSISVDNELSTNISVENVRALSAEGLLADSIDSISATILPDLSSTLSSGLSVTVVKLDTPESGYQATYHVKQGGEKVGDSINIPRDTLISSANMVNVSAQYDPPTPQELSNISAFCVSYADIHTHVHKLSAQESATYWSIYNAYTGVEGGDGPYIRIITTNASATPIYIATPSEIDSYIGSQTVDVSVDIKGNRGEDHYVYATVKNGSVAESKLCSDFTTKVSNVITAEAKDRTDINTVSVGLSNVTAYEAIDRSNITTISTNVGTISTDLKTESTTRAADDTFLSSVISSAMHYRGIATNNELSTGSIVIPVPPYPLTSSTPLSGDMVIDKTGTEYMWILSGHEMWYRVGGTDSGEISSIYATKVELSNETSARISSDVDLANQISSVSSVIEEELAAEVSERVEGDLYLSSQVSAALSNVMINGIIFEVLNRIASVDISCISCGGAVV